MWTFSPTIVISSWYVKLAIRRIMTLASCFQRGAVCSNFFFGTKWGPDVATPMWLCYEDHEGVFAYGDFHGENDFPANFGFTTIFRHTHIIFPMNCGFTILRQTCWPRIVLFAIFGHSMSFCDNAGISTSVKNFPQSKGAPVRCFQNLGLSPVAPNTPIPLPPLGIEL